APLSLRLRGRPAPRRLSREAAREEEGADADGLASARCDRRPVGLVLRDRRVDRALEVFLDRGDRRRSFVFGLHLRVPAAPAEDLRLLDGGGDELRRAVVLEKMLEATSEIRMDPGLIERAVDPNRDHEPFGEDTRQGQYFARPEVVLFEGHFYQT